MSQDQVIKLMWLHKATTTPNVALDQAIWSAPQIVKNPNSQAGTTYQDGITIRQPIQGLNTLTSQSDGAGSAVKFAYMDPVYSSGAIGTMAQSLKELLNQEVLVLYQEYERETEAGNPDAKYIRTREMIFAATVFQVNAVADQEAIIGFHFYYGGECYLQRDGSNGNKPKYFDMTSQHRTLTTDKAQLPRCGALPALDPPVLSPPFVANGINV